MRRPTIPPAVGRLARALGIVFAAAAVAGAAMLAWLVASEPGLRFLVSAGTSRSPVEITIRTVTGRVLGPFRLHDLEARHGGSTYRLANGTLEWNPPELWSRRLHVRSLVLDGIDVALAPPDPNAPRPEAKTFELPDFELPFDVVLDTLRLRHITLRQTGGRDSLVIDEIALDGLQYRDSLGVQRFAVATPWGELSFRGGVRTRGRYPLDLALEWGLRPPDLPPIAGSGTIAGSLDTLRIVQTVTEPVHAFTSVRLESLTTRVRFDATARIDPTSLRTLRKGAPDATVAATVNARGDATAQDVTLRASWAARETGTWDANAAARAAYPRIDVTSFALRQRGSRARVDATGSASFDSTRTSFAARATWAELAWPLVGRPQIVLPRGSLEGEGAPARWTVGLETAVRGPRGREERLRANGSGDTTSFVLQSLAGSLLGGTIDASGRFAWAPAIAWQADVATSDLDVGMLAPEWPSKLGARMATEGTMRGKDWTARLDVTDLAGTLRGLELAGEVSFDGSRAGPSTVASELHYGSAALTANGSALAPMDLAWTIDAPALAEFDTTLAGSLRGSGRLEGRDSLALVTATLEGTDLAYGTTRVARLDLEARLDHANGDALDATLSTGRIESPPLAPFDSLRATATGTRERYGFGLSLASALRRLAVGGTLVAHDSTITGRLERLHLAVAKNAPWALAEPAPFEVAPAHGRFGPLALRAGAARLDADAQWKAGGDAHVRTALAQFPLANLNAFLPDSCAVEGTLTVTSDATLRGDGVLDAKIAMAPLSGSVTWRDRRPIELEFENATLDLSSDAGGLAAKGGASVTGLGQASADVSLAGFRWNRVDSTQAIAGKLSAEASEWSMLEQFTQEVRNVAGKLTADVNLAGTIGHPRLGGEVKLADGAFDAPSYGLEVRELRADARADEGGRWRLDSSMRSGEGTLAAKADADLSDAARPRATVTVTGRDFTAMDITEARARISPDLKVAIDGARVDVRGSLAVPYAKIDAGNKMIALAVPPSPDVIVPRDRPDSTQIPFELHTDIRLTIGDDVSFKGYGLEAKPKGSVRVTQEPNKPALGQGELELESGTYSGYGRDLKIERGRLLYAGGPVDDPEVDIRATREIKDEDVEVGFEVKGTLKKSQLEVFSDPEMAQSDAVSYLLFNRPISEAKSSESAIARETATAIGLQASSAYTQKLGAKFGLDEASLQSEGTLQEASLMLGTYLTPSLYARYGIGLFDSGNTFQLSYLLNKRWTLRAETAEENRAGILYTIEPGRRGSNVKGPTERESAEKPSTP